MESRLLDELVTIPVVDDISNLYRRTKKQYWILGSGLGFVEASCTKILETFYSTGPGSALDDYAGDCVAYWKESYPLIQQPRDKIWRKLKYRTSKRIRTGTGAVLNTLPGQVALYGFDTAVTITDRIRRSLEPANADLRMHVITVKDKSIQVNSRGRQSQSSPGTPLQTNGQAVSPSKKPRPIHDSSKYGVAIRDVIKKKTVEVRLRNFPSLIYQVNVYLPVELYVIQLKIIQALLHSLPGVDPLGKETGRRTGLTPEKIVEINNRRKVSPRKRIRTSFLGNVKSVACQLLGFELSVPLRQTDIRQFLTFKAVTKRSNRPDSPEKKRKHDDILSEDSDSDIENFDLRTYQSDEDPDYQPASDGNSTDSLEYHEGDTESDIEFEETESGLQVKDRTEKTPSKDKRLPDVTLASGQSAKTCEKEPVKSLQASSKAVDVTKSSQDAKVVAAKTAKTEQVATKSLETQKQQTSHDTKGTNKPEQSKSATSGKAKENVSAGNTGVLKEGQMDVKVSCPTEGLKDGSTKDEFKLLPGWKRI